MCAQNRQLDPERESWKGLVDAVVGVEAIAELIARAVDLVAGSTEAVGAEQEET